MGKVSRKKRTGKTIGIAGERAEPPRTTSDKAGKKILGHLLLLALVGFAAYSNSFHAPFQWDETGELLMGNPIIKDLSYFLTPSKAAGFWQYDALANRYFGYLSFALNYRLHGFEVTGYHIVNFVIHIINACLVYFFVMAIFRTPGLKNSALITHSRAISLSCALLFVSHPIQTEAVTYVFQRFASMVTTFYLLSVLMYARGRLLLEESQKENRSFIPLRYSLLCLFFTVLAMKTKENAFTIPFAIMLYEFVFFRSGMRTRLVRLVPFLLTLLIIPVSLISLSNPHLPGSGEITRLDYLRSQFSIVLTYIRLIFFPMRQTIDHDYHVYTSFFETGVLLPFFLLLLIAGLAVYAICTGKKNHQYVPEMNSDVKPCCRDRSYYLPIGFGIAWFFLTLAVESSFIPIPMLICEYRVYLPSIGLFISVVTAAFSIGMRFSARYKISFPKYAFPIFSLIIITFATLSYMRNSLWADDFALWEDTALKSKHGSPFANLGYIYATHERWDDAEKIYQQGIAMDPDYMVIYLNLADLYIKRSNPNEAIQVLKEALARKTQYNAYVTRYNGYVSLAKAYVLLGQYDNALQSCREAIPINPLETRAYCQMSMVYRKMGRMDEAVRAARQGLDIKPDALCYDNLGLVYVSLKQFNEAETAFTAAIRLNPEFAEGYNNLAGISMVSGKWSEAKEYCLKAVNADSKYPNAHVNLGIIYHMLGENEAALQEFYILQRISPEHATILLNSLNQKN